MKNKIPLVSVIIPSYNRAGYLEELVRSVAGQSYSNWELIVVDDGSTDDTPGVVEKIPGIRYRRLEKNSGVSNARNLGIGMARGGLICFLDSDDLWMDKKLEAQVDWMESHPDCRVSYTDEVWIRRGVRVNPMKKHRKYSGDIYDRCLPLCIVSPSSVMIRSSLFSEIGGFDETMPVCEDYDLWLRIAERFPIHFIEEKLIIKRGGHRDQLSGKYWGMDRYRVYALEKRLKSSGLDAIRFQSTVRVLIEKCAILVKGFRKRGNMEAVEYYHSLIEQYSSAANDRIK